MRSTDQFLFTLIQILDWCKFTCLMQRSISTSIFTQAGRCTPVQPSRLHQLNINKLTLIASAYQSAVGSTFVLAGGINHQRDSLYSIANLPLSSQKIIGKRINLENSKARDEGSHCQ